nr:uncharacterized protein LOC106624566 isoform X1 [Bactrocera oleae]
MSLKKWKRSCAHSLYGLHQSIPLHGRNGLCSVIGCVDGVHIGLQKSVDEHMYFNTKSYHSINAMIICDHTYKILAINCQYGGARFICLETLKLKSFGRTISAQCSGFWLPTAIMLQNPLQKRFGWCKLRSIGILKRCWIILGYDKRGRNHPTKFTKFVNVCVALHNICI